MEEAEDPAATSSSPSDVKLAESPGDRWQKIRATYPVDPIADGWSQVLTGAKSAAALARAAQEAARVPPAIAAKEYAQKPPQPAVVPPSRQTGAPAPVQVAQVVAQQTLAPPQTLAQNSSSQDSIPQNSPPPQLGRPFAPAAAALPYSPGKQLGSPKVPPLQFSPPLPRATSMLPPKVGSSVQRVSAAPSGHGSPRLPPPPDWRASQLPSSDEGETHWKWAFKALEQRNRELQLENEALQNKVLELSELSNQAAAALQDALAAAGRSDAGRSDGEASPRDGPVAGGVRTRPSPTRHLSHPAQRDRSVERDGEQQPRGSRQPPSQQQQTRSRVRSLSDRAGGRPERSPERSTTLPHIGRASRSASEAAPAQSSAPTRLPVRVSAAPGGLGAEERRAAAHPPGFASPRGTIAGGPARAGHLAALGRRNNVVAGPSKREIARQYAAKNIRLPKPKAAQTRLQPHGGGGGGGGGSGGGGQDVKDTLVEDKSVGFAEFCEGARALEPGKDLAEEELRRRFDELTPSDGRIFWQDYTLSQLFETLSRQSARVLDLFRRMDTDGSASIDRQEFHEGLRSLGFQYSENDLNLGKSTCRGIFRYCSAGAGAGACFAALRAPLLMVPCPLRRPPVFTHLDDDGSGAIDYVELNSQLRPRTMKTQAYKLRTSVSLKRGGGKLAGTSAGKKKLQRGPDAPPIADQLQAILKGSFLKVLDVFKVRPQAEPGTFRCCSAAVAAAAAAGVCSAALRSPLLMAPRPSPQMYDVNEDGLVSKREFSDGLEALGYDAPREEFDALYDTFDADGSGTIDYYELYKQLRAGRKSSTSSKQKQGRKRRQSSEASPERAAQPGDPQQAIDGGAGEEGGGEGGLEAASPVSAAAAAAAPAAETAAETAADTADESAGKGEDEASAPLPPPAAENADGGEAAAAAPADAAAAPSSEPVEVSDADGQDARDGPASASPEPVNEPQAVAADDAVDPVSAEPAEEAEAPNEAAEEEQEAEPAE